MSTYCIVGVYDDEEHQRWHAVSVGCDGYPSGVGYSLYLNYHHRFAGKLPQLVKRIVEDRPEGWYSIAGKDYMLRVLIFAQEYLSVMARRFRLENAAGQIRHKILAAFLRALVRMVDRLPVAYAPHQNCGFITQNTDTDRYWSEWAYLFDVKAHTLTVFWGGPLDGGPSTTVSLDAKLDLEFWEDLWSNLPEQDVQDEEVCEE